MFSVPSLEAAPVLLNLIGGKTDNPSIQLLRSLFAGGLGFLLDFTCLFILTQYVGCYYLTAAALAFVLGLTVCYLLSICWVFDRRTYQNSYFEFGLFALLGVLSLGLNQVVMFVLTDRIGLHYLASKASATVLIFLWNFTTRKCILFSRPGAGKAGPGSEPLAWSVQESVDVIPRPVRQES
jgi:putative flippase GtrA